MKKIIIAFFIFSICFACSVAKPHPIQIGVLPLNNYAIVDKVEATEDVDFKVFTNSKDFLSNFHMTKSSPGKVRVPDFTGQTVVAVILKPTTEVQTAQIDKAEIVKSDLNIYYSITTDTTFTTYKQTNAAVATVPKALDVKQVNFFKGQSKGKNFASYLLKHNYYYKSFYL